MKVKVPLSFAARGNDVAVKVTKKRLCVGVKGKPAIVDSELSADVEYDDITWQLEDGGQTVVVNMEKSRGGWWHRLMATDPKINTKFPKMTDNQMDSFMR